MWPTPATFGIILIGGLVGPLAAREPIPAAPFAFQQTTPAVPLPVSISGLALEQALPELNRVCGTRLKASAELAKQRVTLYGADQEPTVWRKGLEALLSPSRGEAVFWRHAANDEWILEESLNRRNLRRRLQSLDQERFFQLMEERVRWVRREGLTAFRRDAGDERRRLVHQVFQAALLDVLGAARRERLLAGEPAVLTWGELRATDYRDAVDAYVEQTKPSFVRLPLDEQSQCCFVLSRERNAWNPTLGGLVLSKVLPRGFTSSRQNILGSSYVPNPTRALTKLDVDGIEGQSEDRRVSVHLAAPQPGETAPVVERDMNQVLHAVSGQTGLCVIADGYLRGRARLRQDLMVRNVPLDLLLDRIARAWNCEWVYLDKSKAVALFRAKYWWLEDAADVPQEKLDALLSALGAAEPPKLEAILALAELSEAQIRKLTVETELLKALTQFLSPYHDDTGIRACLRFFNRLTPAQQARATSGEGLSIAEVSPQLVTTHLRSTLIACVGATTEERQADLVFRVQPMTEMRPGGRAAGYQVVLRSRGQPGSNWQAEVFYLAPNPGSELRRPKRGE